MDNDMIEIEDPHRKVADEYVMLIQHKINPALRAAKDKAAWRRAMDWRHRVTEEFWAKMAEAYPQTKDMGCGLLSGVTNDRLKHIILAQGPLETIKQDMESGVAQTLNLPGSEMWQILKDAEKRGLL